MASSRRFELKRLGKYEILNELGRGAMGTVYQARDPFIGRQVALKTITSSLAERPELLERFYQEARSAGTLQHPNIVTIYELGKEGDTPYIAMEYLEGESLEKLIARQPALPLSQKLGYIVPVCRALEYAHKRGVVHRDIKPGNVMVTPDGTVKVVDFGIARLVDASKTQTNMLIGTLGYMSPQQIKGKRADEQADIWAVGVTLYELLCYLRPFAGENHAELMMNIITQEPRPLGQLAVGCPVEVETLVRKMLHKETTERFQTMEDVLLELEPLWKRLQHETVAGLVADSRQLFQAQDLQRAHDLLRKALQIDTSNDQAKSLLEKVNAEIKRSQILPKVQGRVAKGQGLLQAGQLQEAKAEAEAALQLDSTFQPACELLAQVQEAVERARLVQQWLQASKQRFAEGALTEAGQTLDKVLEVDANNVHAQELRKQIREEAARRERRKRLGETLKRARNLWAELRYDECIVLLTEVQKEFPAEAEVAKLLETARQDQAEQQKQQKLAQARGHLAAQRFAEALAILDALLKSYPRDTAVQNMRALVLQAQEEQARQRRFEQEWAALRALVNAGSYPEAVSNGEKLLREFPQEVELAELVRFARNELAELERKRGHEQRLKQVGALIDAGRFPQAIQAAEKALTEFPGNVDLKMLLDQARTQQKENERGALLAKRISEIKSQINREEYTDAISLARQTLVTVGQDTDVAQLLHAAEMEYEQREKKNKEQEHQVQAARTLVDAGKLDDATRILSQAVETRIFDRNDSRVQAVLREIEEKRSVPAAQAAAASAWPVTTPGEPAKDYIYQRGAPQQGAAAAPAPAPSAPKEVPPAAFSATSVTGPTLQPVPPPPQLMFESRTMVPEPQIEEPEPAVERRPVPPVPRPQVEGPPQPAPRERIAPRLWWKQPITLILAAVVLAVGLGVAYLVVHRGPSARELEFQKQAQQLRQAGRLDDALAKYRQLVDLHGALGKKAQREIARIQKDKQDESNLMEEARKAQAEKRLDDARVSYERVISINGSKKQEAQYAIEYIEKRKTGRDVAELDKEAFDRGEESFKKRLYEQARENFKQVSPGSALRPQAEARLKTIDVRLQEQQLFNEAVDLQKAGKNDEAKANLQRVAKMKGDLRAQAERHIEEIDGLIGADQIKKGRVAEIRTLIRQGQYGEARKRLEEVRQWNDDFNRLSNEITADEKSRHSNAVALFEQLRNGEDVGALEKLRDDFRLISQGGGPLADEAGRYDSKLVPDAIKVIRDRKERERQEAALFKKAQTDFEKAKQQRDVKALREQVLAEFEKIARGGGAYSQAADVYVHKEIPDALKVISSAFSVKDSTRQPKVELVLAGRKKYDGLLKPGDMMSNAYLDESLRILTPSLPPQVVERAPSKSEVILLVSINEDGGVYDGRVQGGDPALAQAVLDAGKRTWQFNPPKIKGKPVKTSVTIVLQF